MGCLPPLPFFVSFIPFFPAVFVIAGNDGEGRRRRITRNRLKLMRSIKLLPYLVRRPLRGKLGLMKRSINGGVDLF